MCVCLLHQFVVEKLTDNMLQMYTYTTNICDAVDLVSRPAGVLGV